MKIKIFLSILLLVVIFTTKLNAQCTTECTGSWVDPYTQSPPELAYIVESGQVWKINYKYRECSDGNGGTYKEISLEGLELLSGTASGTTQALMTKALQRLLWMSPSLFTNATGVNGWDVTVVTDCCWKQSTTTINGNSIETRVPCSTSTCCKYTYNVRPTSEGGLKVNNTSASSGNCTLPNSCNGAGEGCNNVCAYGQIPSNTRLTPDDNSCNPCNLPFVPNPNNKVDFTSGSNNIRVYYSYLTCNDTLYISLSEIIGSANLPLGVIKTSIGRSIRAALAANPGITNFKVVIPSCWIDISGKYATKPCSYVDCCTFYYSVNISGSSITVVSSSVETNNVNCGSCTNICNTDNLFESGASLKMSSVNLNETDINLNDKLLVKPNPTTGLSTIEIESESMGRLTLKFLDIQGREVQKIERFKSGKALTLQLDGTNLAQGTYTLQLVIENQVIATTNLIIQK